MKKIYLYIICIVAAMWISGCSSEANTSEVPQQFNHELSLQNAGTNAIKVASVDSLIQSFVDKKKASSIAAFVAKEGDVVYHQAFGWKDIENREPATVDDYYILFSQTKAIVTVAFMTLVEQGLVAVDDPVSEYFPELPDQVVTSVNEDGTYETRPVKSPMTFAHLMSHSSGLNAGPIGQIRRAEMQRALKSENTSSDDTPGGQRSFGADPESRYLEDEMLALAEYPLGFDPGTEWNYHISTNMLGYMIERITDRPLREYVKETVLEPLGMDDTDWYYDGPAALDRFVKAYNAVDGELEPASNRFSKVTVSDEQTYVEGAIGLNGPIEDYAKFCQMLLNKGEFNGHRILKPEIIEQMTTINRLPEVNSGGGGFQFGLGFELYNEQKKPAPEVSNTAYAWGGLYGTSYIIDPANDMIALFYLNMPQHEPLYPQFLSKAYQLFETNSINAKTK